MPGIVEIWPKYAPVDTQIVIKVKLSELNENIKDMKCKYINTQNKVLGIFGIISRNRTLVECPGPQ